MEKQKVNYRRGGIALLIASLFAILLAYLFGAPMIALASITIFGLGGASLLLLLGNRKEQV
jgi:hypothetical protein